MAIPEEDIGFLARVPLFASLTSEERARFADYLHVTMLQEGQVVIWEGKAHENLHIVVEGSLVVTKVVRGEVESVLTHLGERAHFGELDLIDGRKAAATVTAEEQCRLLSITQHQIYRLLEENSDLFGKFAWAMMRDLAQKLRATNLRLLEAVTWGMDAAAIDPVGE